MSEGPDSDETNRPVDAAGPAADDGRAIDWAAVRRIDATFEVITPLLMHGAPQSARAANNKRGFTADTPPLELRLPSIKGVLRYWWRIRALGEFGDNETVRALEASLFGSAEQGQSAIRLRLTVESGLAKEVDLRDGWFAACNAKMDDLMQFATGRKRDVRGLECGAFTLALWISPKFLSVNDADAKKAAKERRRRLRALGCLLDALRLMGALGGVGGRWRRGFGSLHLAALRLHGACDPTGRDLPREPWALLSRDGAEALPDSPALPGRIHCAVGCPWRNSAADAHADAIERFRDATRLLRTSLAAANGAIAFGVPFVYTTLDNNGNHIRRSLDTIKLYATDGITEKKRVPSKFILNVKRTYCEKYHLISFFMEHSLNYKIKHEVRGYRKIYHWYNIFRPARVRMKRMLFSQ